MAPTEPAGHTDPVRVLVVDDHEIVREGLERRLLAGGFTPVGMAGTVTEARAALAETRPDLVLVDHSLPDGSGMEVVRDIQARAPGTVVVMLSAHDEPPLISAYLAAGAAGFATKTVTPAELVRILRAAMAGQPALDAVATAKVLEQLQEPAVAPASPLSPREVEVLTLVAAGCTNDDIAERLYISSQTVKTHLSRVFGKLGVRDRASATARAIRDGLLD